MAANMICIPDNWLIDARRSGRRSTAGGCFLGGDLGRWLSEGCSKTLFLYYPKINQRVLTSL
jgi:hypothetical protein